MFDLDKIVRALASGSSSSSNGFGDLTGLFKDKKSLKKLLQVGTLATIATMAYQGWQKSIGERGSNNAREDEAFTPRNDPALESLGHALIRSMIAAAKADGQIDHDEKQRIFDTLNEMDLGSAEKAFVFDELNSPLDIDAVVRGANNAEQAAEIYSAALIAIEIDDEFENNYLVELAARLSLPETLVEALHRYAGKPY